MISLSLLPSTSKMLPPSFYFINFIYSTINLLSSLISALLHLFWSNTLELSLALFPSLSFWHSFSLFPLSLSLIILILPPTYLVFMARIKLKSLPSSKLFCKCFLTSFVSFLNSIRNRPPINGPARSSLQEKGVERTGEERKGGREVEGNDGYRYDNQWNNKKQ